mmetsp:Transcript_18489/g.46890  ORF Transcript_18489/g.46890 Transcript_18489/m.46890 type:complete len:531 (-) Transcript_18489:357-1949(-)
MASAGGFRPVAGSGSAARAGARSGMTSSVGSSSASVTSASSVPAGAQHEVELDKVSCIGCGSSVASLSEGQAARAPFTNISPLLPLPVLYHSDLRGHVTRLHGTTEVHQEAPERVHNIFLRLFEDAVHFNLVNMLMCDEDVPLASRELLTQVHDVDYIKFLEGLCVRYDAGANSDLPSDHEVLRFSPLVVSRLFDETEKRKYFSANRHLTSATRFSPGTFKAALRAAGAVVRGVEIVMGDDFLQKRCFCLVRPPGHHAGPRGYDPTAGGCGFCLVNNVMMGAAEAMRLYPGCKVAIVDLDVHHGNGTQAIIEKRFKGCPILFCSIHLHETVPGDPDMDFFPGTGAEQDDDQILNIPLEPLWVAKSNQGDHGQNAASGDEAAAPDLGKRKHSSSPLASSKRQRGEDGQAESPFPLPDPRPQSGRLAWRRAVETRLLPKLQAFKADLIIMSTGFDAAQDDEGCSIDGVSGLDLNESDYAWCTELIVNQSGTERIVSVLEGGYGKWSPANDMYDTSSLVNCCLAHIAALVETK